MGSPAKLRLVKRPDSFERELELWSSSSETSVHSLHSICPFPEQTRPEFAQYFLQNYSKKGEVVLDPFCGSGTIPLEAAFMGRIPYLTERDPFALSIASAKLQPADITQVTLFMQSLNLKRPVSLSNYNGYFSEFYDVDTFREIINLKQKLLSSFDRVSRFVELLALSLLHGNNASYFSVFTNPSVSLLPEEQKKLNIQRRQKPDFRPIIPRVLKKVAHVTCDGIPSVLEKTVEESQIRVADARNLNFLKPNSVDLILTSPPLPGEFQNGKVFWLKHWFSDINSADYLDDLFNSNSLEAWRGFMNESLFEFSRILASGHHAILNLKDVSLGKVTCNLAQEIKNIVETDLSSYWSVEGIVNNKTSSLQLKNALKAREDTKRALKERVIILRRN